MDAAGSRKIARKHVLWNAIIISPNGSHVARIRDLSSSGVQISCHNPPTSDCDVIFKRGTIFIAARVAWADETGAGLQFYRLLNPLDIIDGTAASDHSNPEAETG